MIRHRVSTVSALALVSFAGVAHADANSLFDYFGPREIAVGESMRAEAKGALAITLNPAGLPLTRELVFEGGYGYRPDDGTNSIAVSACDSTVPVPGCFYYRYFSSDPTVGETEFSRRAHEFGFTAARAITPNIVIGLTNKYFNYDSDLDGDSSGYALDAGLTFVASPAIKLAVVGYNLVSTADDTPQYPRATAVGLVVRPGAQLALAADALWNLDLEDDQSTGRYGGGLEYFFVGAGGQAGYPIRLGVVHDRTVDGTFVTGGLGYRTARVGLDVGARQQVDGGDELMVLGSIRLFSPHADAATTQ